MVQLKVVHNGDTHPPKQSGRLMSVKLPSSNIRTDDWTQLLVEIGEKQNRQAFIDFFNHFAPTIKGYFMAKSGSSFTSTMADELVQEVMLKVWQKADKFDPSKSAASTWLFTLARNTRIDMFRKQSKHDVEVLGTDDIWTMEDDDSPVDTLQQSRDQLNLQEAIKQLPKEQALVVQLIYLEGQTHVVVAENLQLPLGTVKSRLRLALAKMKLIIGQNSHELEL